MPHIDIIICDVNICVTFRICGGLLYFRRYPFRKHIAQTGVGPCFTVIT